MRLTPLQIDMYMLAGECLPFCEAEVLPLTERISGAHRQLVEATGCDFGYDLNEWHRYLVEHHEQDGYCWSNKHLSILVRIGKAETDQKWLEAVASLQNRS